MQPLPVELERYVIQSPWERDNHEERRRERAKQELLQRLERSPSLTHDPAGNTMFQSRSNTGT